MAKKKKKAKRPGKHYSGAKRRGFSAKAKNPTRHRRKKRSMLNPVFPVSGREMLHIAGGAVAGGIGARAIPENIPFLSQYNSGIKGYALNLLTTLGLAKAAGYLFGAKAEEGVWVGGILMTGGRIVSDRFGKTVVQFAGTRLGYDPSFNFRRMGRYVSSSQQPLSPLPVPSVYPASGPTPPLPVGTTLRALPAAASSQTAPKGAPAAPATVAAASSMGYYGRNKQGVNRFM